MDTKDLFMQFGVFSNKRVSQNQKVEYLTRLSHFFKKLNYSMTILKEKNRGKSSYISVVGDVKKAKYIIATHYDTPLIDILGKPHDPFNDKILERKSIKNLTLSLLLCIIVLFIMILFYVAPNFNNGVFNFHDILGGAIAIILVILVIRVVNNGGFMSRNNLARNTSSVVALLKFAQELNTNKSDYAFAFVDYGNIDYFGYHVLRSYLGNYSKKIIMLDSVGNSNIEVSINKSSVLKEIFKKPIFIYGTGNNNKQDFDILSDGIEKSILEIKKIINICS